jgi:diaminohydroxyphosphoribosylaminopyrimidine deaminase/5-amino-6-(5-phosphoribosylamino)uracil reductase
VADAGIARVVVAMEDPNPLVNGGGIAFLRGRGVDVVSGVLGDAARALNRPFLSVVLRGRPFVTMKVALSQDGSVAGAPGVRTALTGAAANRFIHRERAEVDAIGVGSGTILADDPRLTARGAFRQRPLTRVVFDTRLRTPPAAKLLSTLSAGPVIIMGAPPGDAEASGRVAALAAAGAEVITVAGEPRLPGALELLAARGISSLTVEGGTTLHRALWDSGLVDRVQLFRTPRQLGPHGVAWLPMSILSGNALTNVTNTPLGDDTLIEGYVHRPD